MDREPDRHRHAEEAEEEHHDLGDPLRHENRGVAELVVPQPVRVQVGEDEEAHDEGGDDDERDRDDTGERRGTGVDAGLEVTVSS